MQAFARWVGMMAAGAAAVLAVVWLLEARPPTETLQQARARTTCETDRILERIGRLPPVTFQQPCPPEPRKHWDEALTTRGLIAGAVAVVLLLLSARVGRSEHG